MLVAKRDEFPVLSLLVPLFRDLRVTEVVDLARVAEGAGYGTVWYADERFERDPYAVLAAIAAATTTIGVGPAVTDPFSRHPALTAVAIGALDEVARGRARLGMGAGVAGLDKLHIAADRPATAVREAISIIRGLLAGHAVTLNGATARISAGELRFRARPDIEIAVAAEGPYMTRMAGAWADSVIVAHVATAPALAPRVTLAHEEPRQRPKRLHVVARLDVTVSGDGDLARAKARIRAGRVLWSQYPRIATLEALGMTLPPELDRRLRGAGPFRRTHDLSVFEQFSDAIPDDLLRVFAVAGTEADVARQFRELLDGGVDELMVHPLLVSAQELPDSVAAVGRAFELARTPVVTPA